MTKVIGIRISEQDLERIKEVAHKENRTISNWIKSIIKEVLKNKDLK